MVPYGLTQAQFKQCVGASFTVFPGMLSPISVPFYRATSLAVFASTRLIVGTLTAPTAPRSVWQVLGRLPGIKPDRTLATVGARAARCPAIALPLSLPWPVPYTVAFDVAKGGSHDVRPL